MTRSLPRYARVAMVLHWLIAAALVFMIILGWRMGDQARGPSTFALFQLHKSLGITILLLSLIRLGWRLAKPPPAYVQPLTGWEARLSHLVHIGFYVAMIVLPLSGWLLVSTSKTQIPTLLWGTIPWPHLPGFAGMLPDIRHGWNEGGEAVHGLLAKALTYLLFPLHVAGVIKHQIVSRDEVASRMMPGVAPGKWLSIGFLAPFAGFAAVVLLAYSVFPPAAPAPAEIASPSMVVAGASVVEPLAPAVPVSGAAVPDTPVAPTAPDMPVTSESTRPSSAAGEAPAPSAKALPVADWTVAAGSRLGFTTSWSGAAINGEFKSWTAKIRFSPDDLAGSSVAVSIDTGSVDTGDSQRDQSLPGEDFFNSAASGSAKFVSSKFVRTGPDRYQADGTLTLRGVSKPLSLPFRLSIDGDMASMSGTTSIDRTAFGVGQGEWSATDQIPARVSIQINLKARRQN